MDYLEEALIAYTHREFDDLEEFFLRLVVIILCSWLNIKVCCACGSLLLLSLLLSLLRRPTPTTPTHRHHASTNSHSNRTGLGAR